MKSEFSFDHKAQAMLQRSRSLEGILQLRGSYKIQRYSKGGILLAEYEGKNGIVNIGKDTALNILFNDATAKIQDWAIGLIDAAGFTALADADTMGSHSGWSEFSGYSEGTRPEWDPDVAAAQAITNSTLRDFNITATATLKGIFVADDATKGGSAGTLWATALFAGDIPVANTDLLKIAYTVSA